MAMVILVTHVPLLRMERDDDFRIGGGWLTKLPWEQYDDLTQGAFTDWKPKYEQTDPVFLWFQQDMDLSFVRPGSAAGYEELKISSRAGDRLLQELGYGVIPAFHEQIVDPVRAALALAAPAALLPAPRSSVTFFLPAGEQFLDFGQRRTNGARVQGDADQELVYLPDAASPPVGDAVLERAAGLVGTARTALEDRELGPALRQLLDAADVTFTGDEQMLLAVAALEDLLLPDVTEGGGDVFARRLAHLLGHDERHRDRLRAVARALYRRRSAVIHAEPERSERIELPPGTAAQLLAGAVEALARALGPDRDVTALRRRLDEEGPGTAPAGAIPLAEPPGRAAPFRLGPLRPWFAATVSSSGPGPAPEGTIVSWSPLVGLDREGDGVVNEELGFHLTSMPADAVVSMEEKDIRRDFIMKVSLGGSTIAALAVPGQDADIVLDPGPVDPLVRRRDVVVVGLRLAGFDAFIDPDLLGWYVFRGWMRHRRETVLRQSVIMAMESAPRTPVAGDGLAAAEAAWSLLARYELEARDGTIDRLLDLHRRACDRRFLAPVTRAALLAIALETMLGRFRKASAPVQLEDLVGALGGVAPDAARWFAAEGRAFRNAVAHGQWRPEPIEMAELWSREHEPLAHLLAISRAALGGLLEAWLEADPPVRARHGPGRLLVRTLAGRLA